MTASVREARAADRARLEAIQAATLSDPSPELLEAAVEGPLLALVSCEAGQPVGYLITITDGERAYLPELAVDPTVQRRGHGSALIDAVRRRLQERGVSVLRLTARADDAGTRRFYERVGFEAVERVPDHYESGDDGVIYEHSLDA
ncbi:MAG: N-acetyltransferase [Halapricum sp.]